MYPNNSDIILSPYELLKKAKQVIEDPRQWCQGHYGYDADGNQCSASYHGCVKRCALGALRFVVGGDIDLTEQESMYDRAVNLMKRSLFGGITTSHSVAKFNDRATHAQVMELFDRAMKAALIELTEGGARPICA